MVQSYRTKDLAEAAALVTCKCSLEHIEKVGTVSWFVFEDKERCEALAKDFYFGGLDGVLKVFSDNLKTLKGRLFSG